ncbi:MAG: WzyE family oligosaccharide polymerase [Arsenophonus sp.]
MIIKRFNFVYEKTKIDSNYHKFIIPQVFCFDTIFNIIVLLSKCVNSFVYRE